MEQEYEIYGFKGYTITISGKVFSYMSSSKQELSQFIGPNGYVHATMTDVGGDRYPMAIHRLMAMTFIPIPNELSAEDLEVNHKDGNKLINAIYNLEWCTRIENQEHAYASGTHSRAKKVLAIPIAGGDDLRFRSLRSAASYFGIPPKTLSDRLLGLYCNGVPICGYNIRYEE